MKKCVLLLIILIFPPAIFAQIPAASGVSTTTDSHGIHYYTFSFPGYGRYKVGDGIASSACRSGGFYRDSTPCQGLMSYWDLKNDPSAQWEFGADDTGMFEHQFHINNADASTRLSETKEGPMTTTVTESNNVRVVLTQTGKLYPFGDGIDYPQDCCITMTKTYTFYRHGGAGVGAGASKIFTKTTLNYDGTDAKGPLTIPGSLMLSKLAWYKISGESVDSDSTSCGIGDPFVTFTLSPWNLINQDPADANTDYIFYGPFAKNTSNAGKFIPANTCVSPGGSFTGPEGDGGQPTPGTIYNCVTPTTTGCGSQSISSAVVKAGFIQIEQDQRCGLESLGTANYIFGGYRAKCNFSTTPTLNTNSPISWLSMGWVGDNGIISPATATPFVTEYKTPPTMTPTNATGGTFDTQQGYWTLARTADNVSISANAIMHSPAWLISNWSVASAGLTVGGVTKTLSTDFVIAKTDSTHLLIQYLADVASSTTVVFAPASSGSPTITPANPTVNQGATLQFIASDAGTWACSGCAGSINASTGVYTAPATVTPQQSYGGYQVFANNHIYNTRIDALAVNANSATWIAGAGTIPFSIKEYAFPVNYVDVSTPTQNMGFKVTSGNNDIFPIPPYPSAKIEVGWFDRRNPNRDHHLLSIDQRNGIFREIYQFHTAIPTTGASVTGNVATLTFATDPTNLAGAALQTGDSAITVYGFTGADTYFNVYPVTLTATTSNSVSFALTHGNASASTNGFISAGSCAGCNSFSGVAYNNWTYGLPNSLGGGVDAAGLYIMPLELRLQEVERAIATSGTINHALRMTLNQGFCASSFIWPGTAFASDGGTVPFGARFRLKAAYNISGFSSAAQIILTALKNYGLILADGGTGWATQPEFAAWPESIEAIFREITNAAIAPSNFEAVDESALMISSTSGETTNNRETVTFTRTSDSATATVDIALMGVAVGLPEDSKFIQAGTAAQQLTAYVHGGVNNTVTWSVSPAITGGSLTAGGLLTPPATITAWTSYTVTATSTDNGAIAATMTVWIFPTGSIFMRPGATANFTDSHGNVWAPAMKSTYGGHIGCCGDLSGGPWPGVTDINEYYYQFYPFGDGYFNFSVPNGTYRITTKFGTASGTGQTIDTLEAQGNVAFSNQDIFVTSGGNYKPVDFVLTTTTTTGKLSFVIRRPASIGSESSINGIQIERTGSVVGTTIPSGVKVTSGVSIK